MPTSTYMHQPEPTLVYHTIDPAEAAAGCGWYSGGVEGGFPYPFYGMDHPGVEGALFYGYNPLSGPLADPSTQQTTHMAHQDLFNTSLPTHQHHQLPQHPLPDAAMIPELDMVLATGLYEYQSDTTVHARVTADFGYNPLASSVEDYQQDMRRSSTESSTTMDESSSNTASSSKTVSPALSPRPTHGGSGAPNPHRRRKFDREERRKTHMTRLQGACIECWRIKKRCVAVPHGCCETCNQIVAALPPSPCYRSRVTSSELFRRGPTEDFLSTPRGVRWLKTSFSDSKVWRSTPRFIAIYQNNNPLSASRPIKLTVKQYNPQVGDQDTYQWINTITGQREKLVLPPYAVADIDSAEESINAYINANLEGHIRSKVTKSDTIPNRIFTMSLEMAGSDSGSSSSLLKSTLRLWAATRIIEQPWSLSAATPESDTLDLTPTSPAGSPYEGKIPVTPVMDYQIDAITIHRILIPLRKRILQDLQKKVQDNKPEHFLEVFLCIYILLHNIELTMAHDRWFAMRHAVQGCKWSNTELVEKMVLGGNILLLHFHKATKGARVFEETEVRRARAQAERERSGEEMAARIGQEKARKFWDEVAGEVLPKRNGFADLRQHKRFEVPGYWSGQMFLKSQEWKPVMGTVY